MIEFEATPRVSGPVTILTIPAQYVKDRHIVPGKIYHWKVEEVHDAEQPE